MNEANLREMFAVADELYHALLATFKTDAPMTTEQAERIGYALANYYSVRAKMAGGKPDAP